jgi:CRISPR/Cas system-associated protein Cas10 (large subunit of type III CRISPR-Cas system)
VSTGSTPVAGTDTAPDARGPAEGFDCSYCGRRFAREAYRDLHLGQEHEERLDDTEREAYEAAHDAEAEEIRLFRLKALAVLVLVYFGFLVVYAFTL